MFDIPQSFKQDDMFYVNKNDLVSKRGPYGHIQLIQSSYYKMYIANLDKVELFKLYGNSVGLVYRPRIKSTAS